MSAYSDQSEEPVVKLRSRNSNRDRDRSNRKSVVDQIKSNELHIIGHKKASFTSQDREVMLWLNYMPVWHLPVYFFKSQIKRVHNLIDVPLQIPIAINTCLAYKFGLQKSVRRPNFGLKSDFCSMIGRSVQLNSFYSMTFLQLYRRKIFKKSNYWGIVRFGCDLPKFFIVRTVCHIQYVIDIDYISYKVFSLFSLSIEFLQSFTLRHPMRLIDSVLCISFQVGKAVNLTKIIKKNEKNRQCKIYQNQ